MTDRRKTPPGGSGTRIEYPGTHDEHPGTRSEDPGALDHKPGTRNERPRTRNEEISSSAVHDATPDATNGAVPTGWIRASLTPALIDRFHVIRQLPAGNQAEAMVVADHEGNEFVVKQYRPKLQIDRAGLDLLADANPDYVVEVFEHGESPDGSRWELQRYYRHGSLRGMLDERTSIDIRLVVSQLAAALEHIHSLRDPENPELRIVHRDLKPENVLVENTEPLRLVLADFGSIRSLEATRVFTLGVGGTTAAYAPAMGEPISAAWDWWSLGMIVAEIAGGRHPFEVDGVLLPTDEIVAQLSQGPVPLDFVADPDIKLLCRGLLTRRIDDRWNHEQVARWLAGDSPSVNDGQPATFRTATGVVETIRYGGEDYSTPERLASVFQEDWSGAQELVVQQSDGGRFAKRVIRFLDANGIGDIEKIIDDGAENPVIRFARVLAMMDPDLHPNFYGFDIRPTAIVNRLGSSNPIDQKGEIDRIENSRTGYLATGIHDLWGVLPKLGANDYDARLRSARDLLERHAAAIERLGPDQRIDLRAGVYQWALSSSPEPPTFDWEAARSLNAIDWWAALAADPDPNTAVIAQVLHPVAVAEEQALREERIRAEEAAEESRRRAAEAQRQREEGRRRDEERRRLEVIEENRRLPDWAKDAADSCTSFAMAAIPYAALSVLLISQPAEWWGQDPDAASSVAAFQIFLLVAAPLAAAVWPYIAFLRSTRSTATRRQRSIRIMACQLYLSIVVCPIALFSWVRLSDAGGLWLLLAIILMFPAVMSVPMILLVPWTLYRFLRSLSRNYNP